LIFRLTNPINLQDLVSDPFFTFSKTLPADIITYNCKVLDLNLLPIAAIGSEVIVRIKYTHGEVSKGQIDQWLSIFGHIIGESRCESLTFSLTIKNKLFSFSHKIFSFDQNKLGIKTDNYSVRLKLQFHIPEYLPIHGKKARVYYHGIPSFCGRCHRIGHTKSDCNYNPATWLEFLYIILICNWIKTLFSLLTRFDFIKRLRTENRIKDSFFGPWLETNPVEGPVILKNVQQPFLDQNPEQPSVLNVDLVSAISHLITLQSAQKPPPPPQESSPEIRTQYPRGRGRGRGFFRGSFKRPLSEGESSTGKRAQK